MFVTYSPKGQEPQHWEFIPDDVFQDDAELVEKRFGGDWDAFLEGVRDGSARARRVLLWHLMRQDHPRLRFEDVPRFRMGEIKAEFSAAELREYADKLERIDRAGLGDDEIAALNAVASRVQTELTDALLRERGDDVDLEKTVQEAAPGKADSNS